ncbi:helix-turn-helix domain-containing protein [Sphingomonas kyeonggiensis]|uniref:Excisionase family DNA binding protein n=1 Tax=Sphingomonas kyeonggiensis TaxID=1268553 RepID=A0A7W6NYN6_9SPHN|nr:helix-turn-helix domain-containing protein [Sphingomonas kyeonggiensis]MBB4099789.1 excisionase family DNA binding protein [Sphingomonas kyeonggiensis]
MEKLSEDLLSGAEAAAEYAGVSRNIIYRLTASGEIPAIRKGRRIYYRKSAIERAFSTDGGNAVPANV